MEETLNRLKLKNYNYNWKIKLKSMKKIKKICTSNLTRKTKVLVKVLLNSPKLDRKSKVNKMLLTKQKPLSVNTEPKCAKWKRICKTTKKGMVKTKKK